MKKQKGSQRDSKHEKSLLALKKEGSKDCWWLLEAASTSPYLPTDSQQGKGSSVLQPNGTEFCQKLEGAWKQIPPQSLMVRT